MSIVDILSAARNWSLTRCRSLVQIFYGNGSKWHLVDQVTRTGTYQHIKTQYAGTKRAGLRVW